MSKIKKHKYSDLIAALESYGGDYKASNPHGAYGKHQFIWWQENKEDPKKSWGWGPQIKAFAKKEGYDIKTPEDFLNNSNFQEDWFSYYMDNKAMKEIENVKKRHKSSKNYNQTKGWKEFDWVRAYHFAGGPKLGYALQGYKPVIDEVTGDVIGKDMSWSLDKPLDANNVSINSYFTSSNDKIKKAGLSVETGEYSTGEVEETEGTTSRKTTGAYLDTEIPTDEGYVGTGQVPGDEETEDDVSDEEDKAAAMAAERQRAASIVQGLNPEERYDPVGSHYSQPTAQNTSPWKMSYVNLTNRQDLQNHFKNGGEVSKYQNGDEITQQDITARLDYNSPRFNANLGYNTNIGLEGGLGLNFGQTSLGLDTGYNPNTNEWSLGTRSDWTTDRGNKINLNFGYGNQGFSGSADVDLRKKGSFDLDTKYDPKTKDYGFNIGYNKQTKKGNIKLSAGIENKKTSNDFNLNPPFIDEGLINDIFQQGGQIPMYQDGDQYTYADSARAFANRAALFEGDMGSISGTGLPQFATPQARQDWLGVFEKMPELGYGNSAAINAAMADWHYNAGWDFDKGIPGGRHGNKFMNYIVGEYHRENTRFKESDWDVNDTWGWKGRNTMTPQQAKQFYKEKISILPEDVQLLYIRNAQDWYRKNTTTKEADINSPTQSFDYYGRNPDGTHRRDAYGAISTGYGKTWGPRIRNMYKELLSKDFDRTQVEFQPPPEEKYRDYMIWQTVPKSQQVDKYALSNPKYWEERNKKQQGGQIPQYQKGDKVIPPLPPTNTNTVPKKDIKSLNDIYIQNGKFVQINPKAYASQDPFVQQTLNKLKEDVSKGNIILKKPKDKDNQIPMYQDGEEIYIDTPSESTNVVSPILDELNENYVSPEILEATKNTRGYNIEGREDRMKEWTRPTTVEWLMNRLTYPLDAITDTRYHSDVYWDRDAMLPTENQTPMDVAINIALSNPVAAAEYTRLAHKHRDNPLKSSGYLFGAIPFAGMIKNPATGFLQGIKTGIPIAQKSWKVGSKKAAPKKKGGGRVEEEIERPENQKIESTSYKLPWQVWTEATNLPWSEARKQGYTTGTAEENIQLKKQLLSGWRPGVEETPKYNFEKPFQETGRRKQTVGNYQIQKGDSLSKIAKNSGMSAQELAVYNGIPLHQMDDIYAGEYLNIPEKKREITDKGEELVRIDQAGFSISEDGTPEVDGKAPTPGAVDDYSFLPTLETAQGWSMGPFESEVEIPQSPTAAIDSPSTYENVGEGKIKPSKKKWTAEGPPKGKIYTKDDYLISSEEFGDEFKTSIWRNDDFVSTSYHENTETELYKNGQQYWEGSKKQCAGSVCLASEDIMEKTSNPGLITWKEKYGYGSGSKHDKYNLYGESLDAWDWAGAVMREGGTSFFKAINEDDVLNKPDWEEWAKTLPVGTILGYGNEIMGFDGDLSLNKTEGFLPARHMATVAGYNEDGYPVIYSNGKYKLLPKSEPNGNLTSAVVPKEYEGLTSAGLKEQGKYDQTYEVKDYVPKYEKVTDIADKAENIQYAGVSKGDKVPYHKENMEKFSSVLIDKKAEILNNLGHLIKSNEEYDELADAAIAIALAETKGGKNTRGIWLGDKILGGDSRGMTQLNIESLTNSKDAELYTLAQQLGIKDKKDLDDPATSAMATMLYLTYAKNRAELAYQQGANAGLRKKRRFDDDNWWKKQAVIADWTRNPNVVKYGSEKFNIPKNDQDMKFINNKIKGAGLEGKIKASKDDKGYYIEYETAGNKEKMPLIQKLAYYWNTPISLSSGDAQGENEYVKKVSTYYKMMRGEK